MNPATIEPPTAQDEADAALEPSDDQPEASRPRLAVEAEFCLASPSRAWPTCPVTGHRHESIDSSRLAVCSRQQRRMLSREGAAAAAPGWVRVLDQLEAEGLAGHAMHEKWALGIYPSRFTRTVQSCAVLRRGRCVTFDGPTPFAANTAMGGTLRGIGEAALALPELASLARALDICWGDAPRRKASAPNLKAEQARENREQLRTVQLTEAAQILTDLTATPRDRRRSPGQAQRYIDLRALLLAAGNADALSWLGHRGIRRDRGRNIGDAGGFPAAADVIDPGRQALDGDSCGIAK